MKKRVLGLVQGAFVQAFAFAAACAFVVACSPSNDDGVAGGTSEDAGIIADLNVAGVAQKGPFVKGSAVTVQGVDCKTMKLTGEKFESKVKNDKGEFVVDNVNLSSTCAEFVVSGYYMNELTGKKSAKKLTLHALTDLKDRKNVNINVLTNLEFERVMGLVTELEKSFAEAKEQAEKEVLASFNIKGDFDEAEDLNAFEKGDGNAALLAVSVLTLANANDAEVSGRLEEYSAAIAKNGTLDDSAKTELADWVSSAASSGKLDTIRENIESWGYADSVPAFETYVKEFAEDVIPSSSSKAVIPDTVPGSPSCSSKGDSGTKAGMTSSSSVTSAGSVTSSSSTTVEDPRASYLNPNIDYGEMTDPRDGQVYKTVKIGDQVWMAQNLNYKKDSSFCYNDSATYCDKYGRLYTWAAAIKACPDGWLLPSENDFVSLIKAVGGEKDAATKLKSTSGWNNDNGESGDGTDAFGFSALPAGVGNAGIYGGVDYSTSFWGSTECGENSLESGVDCAYAIYLDYDEVNVNLPSYAARDLQLSVRCLKGETSVESSSSSSQKSSSSSNGFDWNVPKEAYLNPGVEYDSIVDSRDGQIYKTIKIGDQVWMAQNLNYADSTKTPSLKGHSWCFKNESKNCDVGGRFYSWVAAIDSAKLYTEKSLDCGYGKICTLPDTVYGICPSGWHLPDTTEWETLFTTVGGRSTADEVLKSQSGWIENGNGTDAYGFSALPVDGRYYDGRFGYDGYYAMFWSASEYDDNEAYAVSMRYSSHSAYLDGHWKDDAFPIRCIKD